MKVQIQTYSVKRLETPLDERGVRFYSAVAKVDNYLHELYEWRKINPRDPKVGSKVAKKIGQSAAQSPEMFVYKNRGFVILADSIDFDNTRYTYAHFY